MHACHCRSFRSKADDDSDDEAEAAAIAAAGGYDPKVGGVVPKDQLALLDSQYASASKKLSENENPHLLKYLDEKMGGGKSTLSASASVSSSLLLLFVAVVCSHHVRARTDGGTDGR